MCFFLVGFFYQGFFSDTISFTEDIMTTLLAFPEKNIQSDFLYTMYYLFLLVLLAVSNVNFLNIRTPKKFVVITIKVEQDGFSLE